MMIRVLVIGAGALGSFFAARIARAGGAVTLLARGTRLAQLRQQGVVIAQHGERETVPVDVRGDCAGLARPDLVLLCTKAQDLPSALDLLAPFRLADMAVLTVQNGVEAPEQAARALPAATILAGRVHGFFELEDGIVHHVGVEPSVAFGAWAGAQPDKEALLAQCLDQAGIACNREADIRKALWEKFLLASTIGGVGAALGVPVGQIKADPQHWAMLAEAMREVEVVARAKGIGLDVAIVERTLAFVAGFPVHATSSLQRDLLEGRPSEYDCLTGAVIRFADGLGLAVPVLRQVAGTLRAKGLI